MVSPDPTVPLTADPFRGPTGGWTPVSARLASARRLLASLVVGGLTVAAVAVLALSGWPEWGFVALLVGLAVWAWCWWLIGRQVRAMGYAERADDLLVVSGILFRRLVIVPYGRMQLVDVSRGPIDRRFDLATVQLHTAAATTDAAIRGLTPDVAAHLRDQLAALGEQRSAGL
jgi:uncharacterized protein